MQNIEVILVDEKDIPIGSMEKMEVHQKGLLHRAVTVYIFNSKHELMLQQRALSKYHCGGMWSNTCCGHPYPGEGVQHAAERRLQEEMGLRLNLGKITEIQYNLPVTDGLIEHEIGHIFVGISDTVPELNPEEAEAYRFAYLDDIQQALITEPESFTPWFKMTFPSIVNQLKNHLQTV